MDLLSSITLKHLRCFVETYHTHSVADAASALGITQSAASRRISDLEAILDIQLFARVGRRLVPNVTATLLLRHAEAALQKLGAGLDLIAGAGASNRPPLVIGALPTVAATVVPRAVLRMRAAVPDLLIRIETGSGDQLLPRLRSGQLNCVVGRMGAPDQMTGLRFDPLFRDRLAFVTRVTHPLADAKTSASALARYPVVMPPQNAVIRPVVDTFLAARGIGLPEDRIETTDQSVATAILRETDAIWIISRGVAEALVAEGRLAFLMIDAADTIGAIGLMQRGDEQSPEMNAFADCLFAAEAPINDGDVIP